MQGFPLSKKIQYGMGGLSVSLPDVIIMQWLMVRYIPADGVALIAPWLFGVLVLAERITEGISNPFLAHWSDNLRHPWGRRLPFMRIGILPFLIIFMLLFHPPFAAEGWWNVLFLFCVSQCYALFFAGIMTAYLALLPELSSDLKVRVDLTTVQAVFFLLAQVAFVFVGILLEHFGWSLTIFGAAGMILLFFSGPCLLKEPPRSEDTDQEKERVLAAIASTSGNKPFRHLVLATALYFFMLNGMLAMLPYWVTGFLGHPKSDVSLAMAPFLGTTVLFFIVYNILGKRWTKYALLQCTFIGSGIVVAAMTLVGVLPGDPFFQTVILMGCIGAPVAGFMMLPIAMLSDVIDYDEQHCGRRREALFFGVQGMIQKVFFGAAILTFTLLPSLLSVEKTNSACLKTMAGVCAAACLLAVLIFRGYTLRERDGKIEVLGE